MGRTSSGPKVAIGVPLPVNPNGHSGGRDSQAVEGLSHGFLDGGTSLDEEDVHKAIGEIQLLLPGP